MFFITGPELERRFNHHPPQTQEKIERHEEVREVLRNAAVRIVAITGQPTREQSLAITKLEEAMFHANAAIARETDESAQEPGISSYTRR